MSQERKLRAAVVGLSVGQYHVYDYFNSPSVEEIILCETDPKRLQEVGDGYGISKRYTDFSEMLEKEKPDIVSLAVPNFLHCPMAVQALDSGCHVLCEKPLARSAAEAQKMVEAMQRSGKRLMVNFNQRFMPECRALKAMIDDGVLGDIYFVRTVWQRQRGVPWWYPLARGKESCGGGAVIDLGVHVLDRALWMCGYSEAEWVLANTFSNIAPREAKERGMEHFALEDMGVAMVRLKNGAMLELEASWAANRGEEAIITRVYGSKGGAILHSVKGNYVYLERKPAEVETLPLDSSAFQDGYTIRQAFLDAILADKEIPCTAFEGMQLNQVLDAVYQSAAESRAIQLI